MRGEESMTDKWEKHRKKQVRNKGNKKEKQHWVSAASASQVHESWIKWEPSLSCNCWVPAALDVDNEAVCLDLVAGLIFSFSVLVSLFSSWRLCFHPISTEQVRVVQSPTLWAVNGPPVSVLQLCGCISVWVSTAINNLEARRSHTSVLPVLNLLLHIHLLSVPPCLCSSLANCLMLLMVIWMMEWTAELIWRALPLPLLKCKWLISLWYWYEDCDGW